MYLNPGVRFSDNAGVMITLPLEVQARLPAGFQEFLEALVRQFDPEQVVLFGSRARGDAHPDSDTDVLVVMDCAGSPLRQAQEIRLSIPVSFPLDLIVVTPSYAASQRLRTYYDFIQEVDEEGMLLYGRHAA
ncbi:MAG: hypothetical protein GEEBNDBF_02655 [bacterium]|nr:hypothetical protein [bacterium]